MKKYLIINRYSPTDGWHTEESLEFILSLASLDATISILFLQSAALQLSLGLQPKLINRNLLGSTLEAFELFSLQNIYVEDYALQQLEIIGVKISKNINITPFSLNNLDLLYKEHDVFFFD